MDKFCLPNLILNFLDGTVTATALRYTAEHVFTSDFGSRPNADKIVVFVTDGRSSEDAEDLLNAANELKNVPARVKMHLS